MRALVGFITDSIGLACLLAAGYGLLCIAPALDRAFSNLQ